jgi:hypothetical protein
MPPPVESRFPALFSFLFALLSLSYARPASAQVHWDANVQAGFSRRFFSGSSGSAGITGSNGPVVGLEGDVALLPLLRLGAYFDYESAYTGEPAPPQAFSFGARVKLAIPGTRMNTHWWLFTGFGAVAWEAPAYTQAIDVPVTGSVPTSVNANIQAASGNFFEVPIGVGAGWRFHKPWELVAELQGRFGFDMNGSYFTDDGTGDGLTRPASIPNNGFTPAITTGSDTFALLLTVGIGLDE